jgi:hypothetical protein
MPRVYERHAEADCAVDTAAEAPVAPLVQLVCAAMEATARVRHGRALELLAQALAAAEVTLPQDSLIIASLCKSLVQARTMQFSAACGAAQVTGPQFAQRYGEMWRTEALLSRSQRCFKVLYLRWRAGTLFMPTPEELAFLSATPTAAYAPETASAHAYISCTSDAVSKLWPLPRTAAARELLVQGVYGALRTALELDARGCVLPALRPGHDPAAKVSARICAAAEMQDLLSCALSSTAGTSLYLHQLRSACGMSREEEMALRRLLQRCSVYVAEAEGASLECCAASEVCSPETNAAAPVVDLIRVATKLREDMRPTRALELYERALAKAAAVLPPDSLFVADALMGMAATRIIIAQNTLCPQPAISNSELCAAQREAGRSDTKAMASYEHSLAILHARWRAGTLFTLTLQEGLHFAARADVLADYRRRCSRGCTAFTARCAWRWSWQSAGSWSAARARASSRLLLRSPSPSSGGCSATCCTPR